MKSLLLDTAAWDLVLDASGNMALCTEPYAIAQDVACALRLFAGELWYDFSKGVPYFASIVGKTPPIEYFKSQMVRAAKTVPDVVSAVCVIETFTPESRAVVGYVKFTDTNGNTGSVAL